MDYITWQDEYTLDIKEIDDQHKKFVGILNRLYEAIQDGNVKLVPGIIDEVVSYAKLHFATEEKYFDKFNYELAEEHKAEHQKLKENVGEFLARKSEDPLKLGYDLLDFLEDWLTLHLANQDKKYVKCFHEHGLY